MSERDTPRGMCEPASGREGGSFESGSLREADAAFPLAGAAPGHPPPPSVTQAPTPLPSLPAGRFQAVLFDMDGTVADCFEDIQAATNHAMRRLGLPEHGLAAVKSFVGNGVDHLCRLAVGPENQRLAEQARVHLAEHYAGSAAGKSRFYPGMPELLRDLRAAGVKLGLVSNKVHELAVRATREMGGGDLFDVIQGETAELPRKPAPHMLLRALERLGVEPNPAKAAMVGDGPQDIAAGQAAGLVTVAVTWGVGSRLALQGLNPDKIVENARELRALLLDVARLAR